MCDSVPYFAYPKYVLTSTPLCQIQGIAVFALDWSVLLWLVCLTVNIYQSLLRRRDSAPV